MGIMKGRRNKLMLLMFLVMALIKPIYVDAGSLDSLIEENEVVAEQETEEQTQPLQEQEDTGDTLVNTVSSDEFVGGLKEASDLSTPDTRANAVNSALRSVASLTVQVLALAVTVFIVVRIMLDLLYIAIPMTRNALSRGASVQGGTTPSLGSGFSGGVPGVKGGMPSRYSGGMSGSMGQQQSAGSSIVSNSAIMAVASENMPGPDGKTKGSYSTYLKAISKELVIVPVIIVLVATGTLQSLGYLIADVIVKLIGSIGNMI